jgi:hypothetical protein
MPGSDVGSFVGALVYIGDDDDFRAGLDFF